VKSVFEDDVYEVKNRLDSYLIDKKYNNFTSFYNYFIGNIFDFKNRLNLLELFNLNSNLESKHKRFEVVNF
jgi:hypothetical protein